jgi:hypothetical protein
MVQLPADLPDESPFKVEWQPLISLVFTPEGSDLEKTRKALWKTDDIYFLSALESIANADQALPFVQELNQLLSTHTAAGAPLESFRQGHSWKLVMQVYCFPQESLKVYS